MADNTKAIELLFGVAGGGDINGESGKNIQKQLGEIAKAVNLQVKININKTHFKEQLKSLKHELDTTFGKLKIDVSQSSAINKSKVGKNTSSSTTKEYKNLLKLKKEELDLTKRSAEERKKGHVHSAELYGEYAEKKRKSYEEEFAAAQKSNKLSKNEIKLLKEEVNLLEEAAEKKRKVAHHDYDADKNLKGQKSWDGVYANIQRVLQREDYLIKNNREAAEVARELQLAASRGFDKANPDKSVNALRAALKKADADFAQIGKSADSVGFKIKEAFETKVIQNFAYALLAFGANAVRQVYSNVVQLDNAVVDLQIATGKTREETKALVKEYIDLAKQLSATATEVAKGADTWLRQGYDTEAAAELTKNTMYLAKLGQLDSAEAARALTSAMKGYNLTVSESIDIVDKFTAVDMVGAVSAGDIATAMSETAVSAQTAGVSLDRLIGYITTVSEVTQDGAESVGTFYKTMFARMSNIKAGKFVDDETGESLNDVSSVLAKVGVALFDAQGQFKSFETVLDELGAKWGTLNNVQKAAIATAMAGTRQQEKFKVLMENYSSAMNFSEVAASSMGTATEKYEEAYKNSITSKLTELQNAWQEFSQNILDSELVKGGVSFLTTIVEFLNAITENLNMTSVAAYALTAIVSKLLVSGGKAITGWAQSFSDLKIKIDAAKRSLVETEAQINKILTSKVPNKTANDIKNLYEKYRDDDDGGARRLGADLGLEIDQTKDLIALLKDEQNARQNISDLETKRQQNIVAGYGAVATIISLVFGYLNGIEGQAGKVFTMIVSGLGIIGIASSFLFKQVRAGIKSLSAAEKTSLILTIISLGASLLVGFVEAINWFAEADSRAKEEAKAAAEALQKETDALEEVSKAASKASDEVRGLVDGFEKLNEFGTNQEWYTYLNDVGEKIKELYPDKALTTVGAINELLGESYTYEELLAMSGEKRLQLLKDIEKATANSAYNTALKTYESQSKSSTSRVEASGKTQVVEIGSLKEVLDAHPEFSGIGVWDDWWVHDNKFNVEIKADSAKEFVNTVESVMNAYAEMFAGSDYKSDPGYKYLQGLFNEGTAALKEETDAALAYLDAVTDKAGIDIDVNLDADNLQTEYENVYDTILEAISGDEKIKEALANGVLTNNELENAVTTYIATNFPKLFNAVKPSGTIIGKTVTAMLGEVEDSYDMLNTALEDMNELGMLSASTIKKMTEEFPELEKYVVKTANGYVLLEGAINNYLKAQGDSYKEDIDNAIKAYQKDPSQTNYENLKNAVSNGENWLITEQTLIRSSLLDQYTSLLEEQTDALEEQADKYRDICEVRRDLLRTYQEEISYRKELEDKQKNVSDLQTQLALSELDTSAAGQARTRELRSQLEEAQEELDEYTLDHAIQDIISEIDKEETAYDKLIREQVKAIETTINGASSKSTAEIVGAIQGLGGTPVVNTTDSNPSLQGSVTAGNSALETEPSVKGTEVESEPNKTDDKSEEIKLVKFDGFTAISGTRGVASLYGGGRLIRGNIRADKTFGADSALAKKAAKLGYKNGDVFGYGGSVYCLVRNGEIYRLDKSRISDLSHAFARYGTYHTGGFVGDSAPLKSNEEFAKLLRGEFVVTPMQMENFMKKVLPNITSYNKGGVVQYNAPLVVLECDSVTEDTLPDVQKLVDEAVTKIKREIDSAFSRTGYRKDIK